MIADHSGGLTLVSGILAALCAREQTGRGQRVDASIYGTMLALQPMEINFTEMAHPELGTIRVVGNPVRLSETPLDATSRLLSWASTAKRSCSRRAIPGKRSRDWARAKHSVGNVAL